MRPIKEGDIVQVIWTNDSLYCEVLQTPSDAGDMWYVKRLENEGATYLAEQTIAINPRSANLNSIVLIRQGGSA